MLRRLDKLGGRRTAASRRVDLIGNFFLALQTPAVPTRMFAEEADALA